MAKHAATTYEDEGDTRAYALELTEGDAFTVAADDATVWVATEISAYSDGTRIVYANGPTPGVSATFNFLPFAAVYLA